MKAGIVVGCVNTDTPPTHWHTDFVRNGPSVLAACLLLVLLVTFFSTIIQSIASHGLDRTVTPAAAHGMRFWY